jgi:hypothetical protein
MSSSSYNNVSGSSNTVSNKSTGSNSNRTPEGKEVRRALRERFQSEGRPESWWNPHWYYTSQLKRRAKRAQNVLKYPHPRPFSNQLSGNLASKFKVGNIAVRIKRPNRSEYVSLAQFNSKYGHKWKRIPSGSGRLIAPEINSNLRRNQVKVVKFVSRNT